MTHNANEIHLILSEIGAENHAKNEEIVESGYCFVTLNATINLILIESAVQFWRLHSNRKWANYAKLPGNIVGRVFFLGGEEKLIEQVSVQRYMSICLAIMQLIYFSSSKIQYAQ